MRPCGDARCGIGAGFGKLAPIASLNDRLWVNRKSRLHPGIKATSHKRNVLVAQLLQHLLRQGRSAIKASMENDWGLFIRYHLVNPKF